MAIQFPSKLLFASNFIKGASPYRVFYRPSSNAAATSFFSPPPPSKQAQSPITSPYVVRDKIYERDSLSNTPPSIIERTNRQLYLDTNHPLGILRNLIEKQLGSSYSIVHAPNPIVTVEQNFDDLGFPSDHPGRSPSDSYYLNKTHMLRTHTSAHEIEAFKKHDRWLLTADVYRRDEIDSSHYPAFHQVECADIVQVDKAYESYTNRIKILEQHLMHQNIVISDDTKIGQSNPYQGNHDPRIVDVVLSHLKLTLNSLTLALFGPALKATNATEPLKIRWIEAQFPWTGPSYEVEVFWQNQWLEILGTGVLQQATLDRSGRSDCIGWAFGLGLERIAMILFGIPDIRLFWSTDPRFLSQFCAGQHSTFMPYSRHPACYKDISFWCPSTSFHENDFCEIVRDVAKDFVETVELIDNFVHPKTNRKSLCYRINYRSMDRNLSNEEVNELHKKVSDQLVSDLDIEIR